MFHTLPVFGVLLMEGATQTGERVILITAENPERVQGFDTEIEKETPNVFIWNASERTMYFGSGVSPLKRRDVEQRPRISNVETEAAEEALGLRGLR